ncbi:hypothetical protein HER15_14235 [Tenacibaculum mesophilum]|uniref:Uncharacterized protein n=1 Tax=Tenacibaculum mesophilum TaxID=104268 RepID=A0AAE9MQR7_9FLAO|nr:hypothetical protein [Tenacibaculum mesophilum]UTD16564.1 hypothetical protein HER15_14235 [Tenacibaculum mesophilum]
MAKANKKNSNTRKVVDKGVDKRRRIGDGLSKGENTNLPKFEFKPKRPSK